MWPTIFEFSWDTGHMIFFGVFYAVLIVLGTSVTYAAARSIVDMFSSEDTSGKDEERTPVSTD